MRYAWQHVPNQNIQILCLDRRVPYHNTVSGQLFDSRDILSPDDKTLINALLAVPGIVDCSGSGYEFHISKGDVFAWDEIRPAVEKLVFAHFSPDATPECARNVEPGRYMTVAPTTVATLLPDLLRDNLTIDLTLTPSKEREIHRIAAEVAVKYAGETVATACTEATL